jgi:hypothetical protein
MFGRMETVIAKKTRIEIATLVEVKCSEVSQNKDVIILKKYNFMKIERYDITKKLANKIDFLIRIE